MENVLLGLLALAWGIGTPIVALVALVRTTRLREANERLTSEVALLRRQSLPGGGLPPPFAEPTVETTTEPVAKPLPPPAPQVPAEREAAPAVAPPPAPPFLPPPLAVEPVRIG